MILDPLKPRKEGRKVFQFNHVFGPTATQGKARYYSITEIYWGGWFIREGGLLQFNIALIRMCL